MIINVSSHISKHIIALMVLGVTLIVGAFIFAPVSHAATINQCAPITLGLAFGSRDATTGNQVSALQRFLASDSSLYPEREVTGFFGPATQRAVQRFQSRYGIVTSGNPDTTGYGSVGPRTREFIERVCDSAYDEDEDDEEESDEETDIDTIDEIMVYINRDTDTAEVDVVINGGADLSFNLSFSSKTRAITFIGEKLENTYNFDFSQFSSDRKRNDQLKRLIEWEYEEEDEDEDTLTLDDIRKITVTENADGEYVDVVVDTKDGTDPEFDVVAERESKVVTAIAQKLENSFEFDFDEYRSDRTRDRDLARLVTWIEYDEDDEVTDIEITGTTYGGCAMGPNGCPGFTLDGKAYTYTPSSNIMNCLALNCPTVEVVRGTISNSLYEELLGELTPAVLREHAQTAKNRTVACRSYVDGADYAYEVTRNGESYTLDTCKTVLGTNTALQEVFKDIWEEVRDTDTPDSKVLSVTMSPSTNLKQGDTVKLTWSPASVSATDGMYVVISDSVGAALASKKIDTPKAGTYSYKIPSATDFCNNFFSDALGTCGDFTKGKNGSLFTITIATFTPKNACFGYCAPNSSTATVLQTAKTKSFTLGGTNASYGLSDVKGVTSKYVDPIINAADDEYTLYVITLKNGKKHEVKVGFSTIEYRNQKFVETGYTGDVPKLMALAKPVTSDATMCLSDGTYYPEGTQTTKIINADGTAQGIFDGYFTCTKGKWQTRGATTSRTPISTDPYGISDVKSVSAQYTDPSRSRADDEYTLYTISLKDGSTRSAKVYFQSFAGVEETFKETGYTGSVWDITILGAKGSVKGASTTNVGALLDTLMHTLTMMKSSTLQ